MPVFSYLAYPETDKKQQLIKDLKAFEYCEISPADNNDVLILVTDTPDEETNKRLQEKITALDSLESLSMTFGHTD
jgi:nitrate reductase NapAB chaperone NapD